MPWMPRMPSETIRAWCLLLFFFLPVQPAINIICRCCLLKASKHFMFITSHTICCHSISNDKYIAYSSIVCVWVCFDNNSVHGTQLNNEWYGKTRELHRKYILLRLKRIAFSHPYRYETNNAMRHFECVHTHTHTPSSQVEYIYSKLNFWTNT